MWNEFKVQFHKFLMESRLTNLKHEVVAKRISTEASAITIALPEVWNCQRKVFDVLNSATLSEIKIIM